MNRTIVLMRGRNTANIEADARAAGIIRNGDQVMVICRAGDALAQEGDYTPQQEWLLQTKDEVIIIANGGTSAQIVPVIANIASSARQEDGDATAAWESNRTWRWKAIDLQRDGETFLAGDEF